MTISTTRNNGDYMDAVIEWAMRHWIPFVFVLLLFGIWKMANDAVAGSAFDLIRVVQELSGTALGALFGLFFASMANLNEGGVWVFICLGAYGGIKSIQKGQEALDARLKKPAD